MNRESGPVSRILLGLAAVFLITAAVLGFYLLKGSGGGAELDVVIPRGSSIAKVATTLETSGVIGSALPFRYLLRFTGGSYKVRAGEFRFRKNMRPLEALRTLYFGEPILHQVTIPEGWTARQIAQILSAQGLVNADTFIGMALSEASAKKYGFTTPHLEGFLFPDTYSLSKVDGEERIIQAMVGRFKKAYAPLEDEAKAKGYTIERHVTLASVVEKETGAEAERPVIASVFLNRLKKGMRLQSDPTTIYGIENFNGNLTKKDLLTPTPYNTYTVKALPVGPISNPGTAALTAVIRPADTEYLYFVSTNNGSHTFAKTYGEHNRNVNFYQRGPGRRPQGKKP